ncbi:MAG: glycosyl hydrolase family 88 [Paenibacillaceae bacterium]|jgi:unsaturated rhamnogalacturonyl hydrolase|nr:glycosyl hydrolase family 88 [Paenibacillaceae bacterium]
MELPKGWSVRMAENQLKRMPRVKDKWHYVDGVVYKGMEQIYCNTGEDRYLRYVQDNLDMFVQEDGSIRGYDPQEHNIDHINNGKAILFLYRQTGAGKYREAAYLLREQLRTHPRTGEGGFWHKAVYPHQMWLDGLYMGAPFYAEFARLFDEPEALDDLANQLLLAGRHLKDGKTGLYYHAWDERKEQAWADKETGLSAHFWGRAVGWYAMAIVDVLDYLPAGHKDRQAIVSIFTGLAEALVKVQDLESGVWWQVLDQGAREGNYLEASASCMIVYAMLKAIRLGVLPEAYRTSAEKGYVGILNKFVITRKDGTLQLIRNCAVAGLGGYNPGQPSRDGSFEYYISEPIVTDDHKGIGAFLLAAAEYDRF